MTGDIGEILAHFFENPDDQRPDVKELARLLRMEDEPLPTGFRSALAEVLDSRLSGKLVCKWALKLFYIGRHDKARHEHENETNVAQKIDAALRRGLNIEDAIQQIVDDGKIKKKHRAVWHIWRKIKGTRQWRRLCAKAAHSEEARRAIIQTKRKE